MPHPCWTLLGRPRPQPGRCVCIREAWPLPSNRPGRCLPLMLPIRERAQASLLPLGSLPRPTMRTWRKRGPPFSPQSSGPGGGLRSPLPALPKQLQRSGGALMSGLQRAPPRARKGCLNQMPPTQVFLVLRSPISHRLGLDCGPGPFLAQPALSLPFRNSGFRAGRWRWKIRPSGR